MTVDGRIPPEPDTRIEDAIMRLAELFEAGSWNGAKEEIYKILHPKPLPTPTNNK